MLGLFAGFLAGVGKFVANLGSQACIIIWLDEPVMPKSLIK